VIELKVGTEHLEKVMHGKKLYMYNNNTPLSVLIVDILTLP
jgi:hypothetical protein